MAEIRNGTLDSVITPTSIFFSHLDDQSFDLRCGSRPTGFAHAASIVLVCDELPMPCQQSFRSDDGCNSVQGAAAQFLGSNGKTATLVVGEA
jgi:hypothetical protein